MLQSGPKVHNLIFDSKYTFTQDFIKIEKYSSIPLSYENKKSVSKQTVVLEVHKVDRSSHSLKFKTHSVIQILQDLKKILGTIVIRFIVLSSFSGGIQ